MSIKIRVVMCPVDRPPYITNISNTLENMQRIVGGFIEVVPLYGSTCIVCNEEGRINGLPVNRSMPIDIRGDAFIVSADRLSGEFIDIDKPKAWLAAAKENYTEGANKNGR